MARTSTFGLVVGLALAMAVSSLAAVNSAAASTAQPATVDVVVRSFDGTFINAHFFPSSVLTHGRAPVILLAHGYGEAGPTDRDGPRLAGAPRVKSLVDAGFNVLTWDARGMGASGGTARFDDPAVEVRDVERLIDWVARRQEVELDGPGDPRLGMTGASYGGIIQYSTAALDRRVDAIAPAYTAYSLSSTTMSSYGKFKEGWGLLLGAISTTTIPPGLTSPLGPQVHAPDPQTVLGLAASTSTGELTSAFREYLDRRSPSTFLDRVDVPTLITGGTSDTLFPLINAVTDYRILKARHVPVAMMWNCEGHSVCPGQSGPLEKHFDTTQVRWFQRWLFRDSSVRTGPGFTWIADNENSYRSAPSFPVAPVTYLTGSGSGRLVLSPLGPLQSLGVPEVGAKPGVGGVDVPIGPPRRVGNVVGFPRLSLSYRGTALPARSWIYAQVVDRGTGRVVGGQVTPVPVVLDGRERSVVVNLNAITSRATLASRYVLQLLPGSLVFGLQRSSGLLRLINVGVRLPVAP